MLQNHLGRLVKLGIPILCPVCPQTHKLLDFQFDRSERILDFVGHLAGHFAPGTVPLRLGQLTSTAIQFPHHLVVGLHQ